MAKQPTNPAKKQNEIVVRQREKQATSASAVFAPCLRLYQARIPAALPSDAAELSRVFLNNLTDPLWKSYPETLKSIRARFEQQWKGRPDQHVKIESSVANSKKKSAGGNFQSLVSYALARYLVASDSAWYIHFPVPKEFRESLAIEFTAGVPPQPDEEIESALPTDEKEEIKEVTGIESASDNEEGGEEAEEGAEDGMGKATLARVNPDVDILLRNVNWVPTTGKREPIVLLSVKTSIIDRGGSAARWKMYFDLANDPCPHICETGCAYAKLGIQMENAHLYDIRHGIMTANIYSMGNTDLAYREGGELNNQQTRGNTYMFRLKLTTRDDDKAKTPDDWKQFEYIVEYLAAINKEFGFAPSYTAPNTTGVTLATPSGRGGRKNRQ